MLYKIFQGEEANVISSPIVCLHSAG